MNKLFVNFKNISLVRLVSKQIVLSLLSSLLSFISIWVIIKNFPISVYGKFSLYQSIIFLISLLGSSWLNQIILQQNNHTKIFVFKIYKIAVLIIYIFSTIQFILMYIITKSVLLCILSTTILIIQILFSLKVSFNFSDLKIFNNFLIEMVRVVLLTIFLLFFVYFFKGNMSVINLMILYFLSHIGLLLAVFTNIKLRVRMLQISFKEINFLLNSNQIKYGYHLIFWAAFSYLLNISDRYFIEFYSTNEELGIYSASYDIANKVISVLFLPISYIIMPVLKKYSNNLQFAKIDKTINIFLLIYFLILIFVNILFYIFSDLDFGHFGIKMKISKIVMIITSSSIIFQMALLTQKSLELNSKNKLLFLIISFTLIINVILNFIFIPKYSYEFAAYSSLISSMIYFFLVTIVTRKFFSRNVLNV